MADSPLSGNSERHDPLLRTLPEHPDGPPALVDVVDVEAAELADPDSAGVQKFHDCRVPQADSGGHIVAAGGAIGLSPTVAEHREDLIETKHLRQLPPGLQRPEQRTRIG